MEDLVHRVVHGRLFTFHPERFPRLCNVCTTNPDAFLSFSRNLEANTHRYIMPLKEFTVRPVMEREA